MPDNFIEISIRKFLQEQFMIEHINYISNDDELALDSLAQTELRLFIEKKFSVKSDYHHLSYEQCSTLSGIIRYIKKNTHTKAA